MFPLIDWLSFGNGGGSFEIGRPMSKGWKNFRRSWTTEVLRTRQFSWTSYVYRPFLQK